MGLAQGLAHGAAEIIQGVGVRLVAPSLRAELRAERPQRLGELDRSFLRLEPPASLAVPRAREDRHDLRLEDAEHVLHRDRVRQGRVLRDHRLRLEGEREGELGRRRAPERGQPFLARVVEDARLEHADAVGAEQRPVLVPPDASLRRRGNLRLHESLLVVFVVPVVLKLRPLLHFELLFFGRFDRGRLPHLDLLRGPAPGAADCERPRGNAQAQAASAVEYRDLLLVRH